MSEPVIAPYAADDLADMLAFIETLTRPGEPLRALLERQARDGFPGNAATLLVRAGGILQGVVLVDRRPLLRPTGRKMTTVPMPGCAIDPDAALRAAADAAARAGVTHLVRALPEGSVPAIAEAERQGFRFVLHQERMVGTARMPAVPVPPGVTLDVSYDGRDRGINDQIGSLLNRMFRGDPMVPPVDAATVAMIIALPGARWIVATEDATGHVVGAAEISTGIGLFDMVCVARRYWGTGLAAALVWRGSDILFDGGHPQVTSFVRPSNAASIALHEACGSRRTGALVGYYELDLARYPAVADRRSDTAPLGPEQ